MSVGNLSIVSVSPSSITIPQGNTVPDQTVTVTAVSVGATSLLLDVSNLRDSGIPIFVNDGFIPSEDDNQFYAASVSVFRDEATMAGPFVSDPVSVFRDTITASGPFVADPVSVFRSAGRQKSTLRSHLGGNELMLI